MHISTSCKEGKSLKRNTRLRIHRSEYICHNLQEQDITVTKSFNSLASNVEHVAASPFGSISGVEVIICGDYSGGSTSSSMKSIIFGAECASIQIEKFSESLSTIKYSSIGSLSETG